MASGSRAGRSPGGGGGRAHRGQGEGAVPGHRHPRAGFHRGILVPELDLPHRRLLDRA